MHVLPRKYTKSNTPQGTQGKDKLNHVTYASKAARGLPLVLTVHDSQSRTKLPT
jgi:hypothetical protein